MRIDRSLLLLLSILIFCSFAGDEQDYYFIRSLFNDKSYNLVIQEADRFLGEYPESRYLERVLFIKGESEFKVKNFNGAIISFKRFVKLFAQSDFFDDAFLRIGQAYYHLAEYDSAIRSFKQIPVGPNYYNARYMIGESFYRKGDYRSAILFYRSVLDSSDRADDIPLCLYSLGYCYQKLKDYSEAIELFDSLISTYPQHHLTMDAALAKGSCLVGLGKIEEAIRYLDNVSEQDERVAAQAKVMIAEILIGKKEFERARIQYERITRYYPESEYVDDSQFGIGLTYFYEGNYVRAIDVLEDLLKRCQDVNLSNKTRYYLGLALIENKEYSSAREYLNMVQADLALEARYQIALSYYYEKNYPECLKISEGVLRDSLPDSIRVNFIILQAEAYYASGNYKDAIDHFVKIKKPEAIFRAGMISYKIKDYNRALANLEEAKDGLPDSLAAEAIFYCGECHYKLNNLDEAKKNYRLIIERDIPSKRKAEAYYGLGWVEFQQGRYLDAIKNFKKIFSEFPQNYLVPEALIKIGDCYFNIKSNEEAINYYEEVIKNYPSSQFTNQAALKAGNACFRLNRFDEAHDYYIKARNDTSLASQVNYLIGLTFFRKGNYESAIKEFARVKESNPLYWPARYATADAYYNLGKYAEAKWIYKTIITRGDSALFAPAVDGLIWTYEKVNLPDEAVKEIEALIAQIEDREKKIGLLFKKGNLLYNKGRYTDAASEFGRVISNYPESDRIDEAIYWSGWCCYQVKDYEKARAYFRELVDKFKTSKYFDEANFLIGKISFEMKEYKIAIRHLAMIKSDVPKPYQDLIHFYLGRAYYEMGEKSRSIELWSTALNTYPESDGGMRAALELGKIWLAEKRFDQALGCFRNIVSRRADEVAVEAQFNIGEVFFTKGDFKNAAIEYLRLSYVYSKFTDWVLRGQIQAARAYIKIDEIEPAKSLLNKIIEKHPDTPYSQEAKDLLSTISH